MFFALLSILRTIYCYLRNLHEFSWCIYCVGIRVCEVDREFVTNGFDLSIFHRSTGNNNNINETPRSFISALLIRTHVCAFQGIKNNSMSVSFPLKQKPLARSHRNTTQCTAIHTINLHVYAIDTIVSI